MVAQKRRKKSQVFIFRLNADFTRREVERIPLLDTTKLHVAAIVLHPLS
jgi:hypothetical protein